MAPTYQKPINTLKRAEDLIALSQKPAALELLLGVIFSKKIKNTLMSQLEPIMIKFIDLCVELRKGKFVKEGLHQFKNIAQQANAQSVEKVITHLLDVAEKKICEAKAESEAKNSESATKQQAEGSSLELFLLNSVSLMADMNRIDQSTVSPWLKFMWDIYRTALDTLRSNNRFKALYQSVATRAFKFCLEYNRKPEFGRLCDLLRQHVSHINKWTRQNHHIVSFKDQDTVQRYLEVRFLQLDSAVELQLWQEAFRSIEDINGLILMCRDTPKLSVMTKFYKNLASILLIAGNYPFHTEVMIRYYNIMLADDSFTSEDQCKFASKILISSLASIPQPRSGFRTNALNRLEEETPRTRRLQNLFQISQHPTREHLINEIISMGLIEQAGPEAKLLFDILEVYTQPHFLTTDIEAALESLLACNPENEAYIFPLCQVLTIRLMQHLSKVYSVVTIDNMLRMMSFLKYGLKCENNIPPPHEIWRCVVDACSKAGINVYVDEMNRCIYMNVDVFVPKKTSSASYSLQFSGVHTSTMYNKLSIVVKQLEEANILVESVLGVDTGLHLVNDLTESLKVSIPSYDEIKEEFDQIKSNLNLISQRKAQRAEELRRVEREEALRNESKLAAAGTALPQMKPKPHQPTTPAYAAYKPSAPQPHQVASYSPSIISQPPKTQVTISEDSELKKRLFNSLLAAPAPTDAEFKNKLKHMFRRVDHLERAYRLEELPYLKLDLQNQKVGDEKSKKEAYEARLSYSKLLYESNMEIKTRLQEIEHFYSKFKNGIMDKIEKQCMIDVKNHEEYVAKVKEERIKAYKEQERRRIAAENERIEADKRREQDRIKEEMKREQERIEEEKRIEQKRAEAEAEEKAIQHERAAEEAKRLKESRDRVERPKEIEVGYEQDVYSRRVHTESHGDRFGQKLAEGKRFELPQDSHGDRFGQKLVEGKRFELPQDSHVSDKHLPRAVTPTPSSVSKKQNIFGQLPGYKHKDGIPEHSYVSPRGEDANLEKRRIPPYTSTNDTVGGPAPDISGASRFSRDGPTPHDAPTYNRLIDNSSANRFDFRRIQPNEHIRQERPMNSDADTVREWRNRGNTRNENR